MEGAFLSSLLSPTRKAMRSLTPLIPSGKKKEKRSKKLLALLIRSGPLLMTLAIVLFFIVHGLVSAQTTSTSGSKKSSAASQSMTLPAAHGLPFPVTAKDASGLGFVNQQIVETVSKKSALTSFPDNTSSALSSALVTAQTQHLSSQQQSGKGGVLDVPTDPCANYASLPNGGGQYITGYQANCTSNVNNNDWLIGYSANAGNYQFSGLLYTLDQNLTIENPTIDGLLISMQLVAAAMLTPIIAIIGIRVLVGSATARFADAIESIPRLVMAVIAVAFAKQLIEILLTIPTMFIQYILAATNLGGLVSEVVTPSGQWVGILTGFVVICVGFIILSYVSQLSFFGTNFGAFIAIVAALALSATMIGVGPIFIRNFTSMIIAAQLIMRMVLLDFYIVFSPIAIISAGLPGRMGQGIAMGWIKGLCSLMFAQVAQILVLMVGLIVLQSVSSPASNGSPLNITGPLIDEIVKFGILTLMIRVPSLFKSDALNLAQQAGAVAGGISNGHFTSLSS